MSINNLTQAEKDLLLESLLAKLNGSSTELINTESSDKPSKKRKRKRKSKNEKDENIEHNEQQEGENQRNKRKPDPIQRTVSIKDRNKPPQFLENDTRVAPEDTNEFDKKVWANRKPTERKGKVQKVQVRCERCLKIDEVYPSQITQVVGRNNDTSYRCNNCSMRGG